VELKDLYEQLDLLSEFDRKPVKSRLSPELKEKFLTANQWLEKGFKPKPGAFVYEMHPASLNKKLCSYFFVDDVEPCVLETCAFCVYYEKDYRYCPVVSEHVSVHRHCSEFEMRKSL
jgi:hypothetical protein